MLYLIGLGLNENSISLEGLEILKKCKKIYLENYTVNFPYTFNKLEKTIKKKIIPLNREDIENNSNKLIQEAKKQDITLLVYGNPLMATTHISLIEDTKKQKIKYQIIHNTSILDAIAETGLQTYKFGKIASVPKHEASSFLKIMSENKKINAHTLVLIDIGLELNEVLDKLKNINGKIILCSQLGTKNKKIIYKIVNQLKKIKIKKPFCIIIPGELHFIEKEFLENLK
jgi:diphthine synthase